MSVSKMEFKHPFTMIVAGPTSCGKTVFVNKLLEKKLFNTTFDEIIWCYSEEGSVQNNPEFTFVQGIPNMEMLDGSPKLIVLDDLMHESNDKVAMLFTKGSHHRNVSVIFITQNIFHQKKNSRDMNLNSHYLVAFKNPRDRSQIAF